MKNLRSFLLSLSVFLSVTASAQQSLWPKAAPEAKPFSRWWWLGSAVDEKNLDYLLDEYAKAGLGGLEITPIYGVQGNDANDIPFLSPKWMQMLNFLNNKGDKVGLKIDMNTGTGWPFGGPTVSIEDAASKADFDKDGKLIVGKTKQKVKRAAPGGEGYVLDHFNKQAVERYLDRFTQAFASSGARYPHNFFNDSYEVYQASWTPSLFDEFKKRRGYDLSKHNDLLRKVFDSKSDAAKALAIDENSDESRRIISDYRQTLGELLLENFTTTWTSWAHDHGTVTRNQAHGSPGNLIDIYAAVDIPECEGFGLSQFGIKNLRQDSLVRKNYSDLSMLKYASSAAHISGKNLTSSESFTWLTEHFRTSLSQCKPEIDLFMTAGINHMYFHGTCYSPKDDPWPGWKFYASVDMSPTNSIWRDTPEMCKYITRCQSFMQMGQPDNDFLVYVPIYDMWQENGGGLLMFDIHKMDKLAPKFIASINSIVKQGYDCDYISDNFIRSLTFQNGMLRTEGGTEYKGLVVPGAKLMPHDVLAKLLDLAKQGATIVFLDQFPQDVPGYGDLKARRKAFKKIAKQLPKHCASELSALNAVPEEMKTVYGLSAIRRKNDTGYHYFISSLQDKGVSEWLSLGVDAEEVAWFNPMNGDVKKAMTRKQDGKTQVYIHLASGESCILQTYNNASAAPQNLPADKLLKPTGKKIILDKDWALSFPSLNKDTLINRPCSWTELGDAQLDSLAGSGIYTVNIDIEPEMLKSAGTTVPEASASGASAPRFILNLGDVRESARVTINGKNVGTLWAVPFEIDITDFIKSGCNTLEVEVTNLPANRIAALDRKNIPWRKYKEINLVDLNYKKTGYAHWQLMESGLNSVPCIEILQ
ncbi:MAG: glycosyl hydrolase family 2 [Bacteroidaceae bacterium]|nr:glycosyl hydrolase family 2 [Bacteroidaceae bacterium]